MIKWIKKKYKNANKILKRAPARTIDFFNNLISGIVGGGIILYISLLGNSKNILAGLWYVLIIWIIGLFAIKNALSGSNVFKKKHINNYYWNTVAALVGGFYIVGISVWNKLLSSIILIVLAISIMLFRNKKR